jgi:hypothetical protein
MTLHQLVSTVIKITSKTCSTNFSQCSNGGRHGRGLATTKRTKIRGKEWILISNSNWCTTQADHAPIAFGTAEILIRRP